MNVKHAVSVKKIGDDAEALFRGGFFCSEAVVSSMRSNFELDLPEEIIAMASGFPVGIGRSKCLCGAVSGGVMALGIFFGRTKVSKELHDWFKESNGKNALCCRILTKGFDMGQGEHKEQCIHFTGMVAKKVAEIVVREYGLTNTDEPESAEECHD